MGSYLSILVMAGYLSAYALSPTEGTIKYRQERGELPQSLAVYDVFVAVESCELIGREGILYVGGDVHKAIVFDCAGGDAFEEGKSWMERDSVIAEVDYWTWQEHPSYIGSEWAYLYIFESKEADKYGDRDTGEHQINAEMRWHHRSKKMR